MAGLSIADLARALGALAEGDLSIEITGAAEPAAAGPQDLALALSPTWAAALPRGRARAALVWPGADWRALGLKAAILAPRGRLAMARLTQALDPGPLLPPGIHPTAVTLGAEIGAGVSIGAHAVIGAGARIGAGTRIGPQVTIAPGAELGEDCLILSGARIGPRVRIGARAILQFNSVIGGDGFSFVTATPAPVEAARETLGAGPIPVLDDPTWHRIHSLGGVMVGDDVELGANSTIDAGTVRPTRVGRGTKIDNLVQIGHNASIGEHCLFASQSGVAGSTVVGDRTVFGGRAAAADNLVIGADVVLTGGTIALSNVPDGRVMMGYPATRIDLQIESYKALRRLPRLLARLTGAGQKAVPNPGESD